MRRRTRLRLLLLAGTALSLAPMTSALAQDATWLAAVPGTNLFSDPANWSPVGVPTGTAFFDTSTVTAISNSTNVSLGGFTFNAGASAYTITNNNTMIVTGAGIVNNSGQTQNFINNVQFEFHGSSTAGNSVFANTSELAFFDTATAGNAAITNFFDLIFVGSSTAGNATIDNRSTTHFYFTSNAGAASIVNNASRTVNFHDNSSAASSVITNSGNLNFLDSSTAGNAKITNGFLLTFFNNSTAGNAEITNNVGQTVAFRNNSTAGNAVIVNNGGLNFVEFATGGNATLITNSGGITDFSFSTGPNGDGKLSAGSIAGAGSYVLGTNELTVGGNNSSTAVSGVISGSGSLVKTGTGTLTLSGANTYAGGTTITGGAVSIAAEANLGAAGGALTLNGGVLQVTGTGLTQLARNIVFGANGGGFDIADAGNTFTVTQSLSGTGALSKAGAGTLVLSGANTYTGATTVAGGTLRAGAAGSFSAASAFTVASGATLDLAGFSQSVGSLAGAGAVALGAGTLTAGGSNASTTFSGAISGTGGLTKAGAGTFTLSGANSYTGTTTVAAGTLQAGAAGAFAPSSAFTVASGAVLDLAGLSQSIGSLAGAGTVALGAGTLTTGADGSATAFSGAMTGTGGLTKTGAGTFTLSGANSYTGATTVAGGTLRAGATGSFAPSSAFTVASGAALDLAGFSQSIGSLAGAGTVALGAGTLSTGSDNTSTTFSGAITGTGDLIKTGAGTFTLTGTSSHSGATTVQAGRLVVNGVTGSAVTVNGGAIFGGSGTVGGIVVASGGTVAPGNSIGTLSVTGNVAFAAGSTYQVEINAAGQGDRINATGFATLSGGTVQVLAEAGNYAAATSYTILTANGGVTGQFAGVTSNLAFLSPTLVHGSNDVRLTMTRNDATFGPDGSGRPYIAATRNQGFIGNAAERLGVGNPVYDTLISATAAEARAGFDLLSGEAHAQGVSVAVGESRLVREAVLGRLRGTLLPGPGAEISAGFSADLPSAKGPVAMPAPRPGERFAIWGEAVGAHANSDGDGNAASLSRRTGGAILGADMKLYDSGAGSLRVGIAGGYTQSNFDVDGRLSSGRLESGHALLYAGARYGNWRLDGGIGYSFGETSLTRQVRIRGFGDSLRSDRDTDLLQGFAELGYAFRFERFALEPFAQLALLRVSSGSAIEQGGAAALWVAAQDQTLGFTTLGLRAEAQLGAMPLFARGLLGWRYGFGDLTPQATTGFASAAFVAGTPARVYAAEIDRNALVAEAGLDWRVSKATTLGLAYSAAIGERTRDHALKGRFEVRF
jgi:outer membrane autotransporter protein